MGPEWDAELHDWRYMVSGNGKLIVLQGYIFSDTKGRFHDGELVTTSYVVAIEEDIIYTKNSVYILKGK